MFNISGKRPLFFVITAVLLAGSAIALAVLGLKPGIDFSSGSVTTLRFEQAANPVEVKNELANLGYSSSVDEWQGDLVIHTVQLTATEKTSIEEDLETRFGFFEERGFESVDPIIAEETARTAGIAVGLSAVGILVYLTWAFRRMPRPLHYGACAVIALIHDLVIVLGIFSVLGGIFNWEINLMFITGVLAVIGYSVNNTVVVFDRIRENLQRGISPSFNEVINTSLVESLSRSLNTSLTTVVVVLALVLFVGVSIQNFAVVLLIGVIAGTYSSLFIAPMLLAVWEKGYWRGFIQRPTLTA